VRDCLYSAYVLSMLAHTVCVCSLDSSGKRIVLKVPGSDVREMISVQKSLLSQCVGLCCIAPLFLTSCVLGTPS